MLYAIFGLTVALVVMVGILLVKVISLDHRVAMLEEAADRAWKRDEKLYELLNHVYDREEKILERQIDMDRTERRILTGIRAVEMSMRPGDPRLTLLEQVK